MKTHILAGLILTGVLATTAVQAATPVDEIYSGMSAAAIQKDQQANLAAERHSVRTCAWREAEGNAVVVDQLHAAYPGSEANFGEKDYLASANQNFVC
ncbi:hypothetical protein [Candidatus Ferrigenium straubiae]|jgi:phenolic acid decarboxylase|uniref:hypothetical protein n=1 Tax=Candidatus Ferrigenium straubiae TaxID=2919506 RepID=UPI003F4ADF2F